MISIMAEMKKYRETSEPATFPTLEPKFLLKRISVYNLRIIYIEYGGYIDNTGKPASLSMS